MRPSENLTERIVNSERAILNFENFKLSFKTELGYLTAVDNVSFKVMPGEIMGLVGESGCGKSVTSLSAMKLLPSTAKFEGKILFKGQNIIDLPKKNSKTFEEIK